MTKIGVSLLSGGLDSTTVTSYAKKDCDHLSALTFIYGQSHSVEVDCAKHIVQHLGVEHELIDISFLEKVAWYSALTNPDSFPVPQNADSEIMGSSIPITYVPLRNTIFMALSAAYLESKVLHAIEIDGLSPSTLEVTLYIAPNAIDYSGYPDCRPEFFKHMKQTLQYGSKLGVEYGINIQIETPIINMSKSDIVRMGIALQAPLAHTWSCYKGGELPCGTCDSCVLRAKGFSQAKEKDPLLVRLGVV